MAGVAAAPAANAVVVTTFANTSVAVPSNIDGVYLNFLNGATGTAGASVAGWDFNPYLATSAISFFWNNAIASSSGGVATAATGGTYINLSPGATVSSASVFTNITAVAATVAFQPVGTHTLGFRFQNETTGIVNYGYLNMTSASANGLPATINGWVYENSGAAITVSAVPEASTSAMMGLGALALGAVNLRRIRRQRRTQA